MQGVDTHAEARPTDTNEGVEGKRSAVAIFLVRMDDTLRSKLPALIEEVEL